MGVLEKCARDIHTHQRNAVAVEFLERFDAPAAAAFSLRGVDHLPRLIVLLLEPVAGFGKIKNHRDQHAESLEIFQYIQKRPSAEAIGNPIQDPLDAPERRRPTMAYALFSNGPGIRPLSLNSDSHVSSLPPAPVYRRLLELQLDRNDEAAPIR